MKEFFLGIIASFGVQSIPCEANGVTGIYDTVIKSAVNSYWTPVYQKYWCFYKSQLIVESGLRPDVRSPVGAQGLAQIMPATWEEVTKKTGVNCHPYDAACSISMGAFYMNERIRGWSGMPRSDLCRLELAWASYNAGFGNIIKMQKVSGMKRCWDEIGPHAPKVTGRHALEVQNYITRIHQWTRKLMGG